MHKIKLAICIPMYGKLEPLCNKGIEEIYKTNRFDINLLKMHGTNTVSNRNILLSKAQTETDCDLIFTLDSDVYTPISVFLKMVESNKGIIFGAFKNKFEPAQYICGFCKRDHDNVYDAVTFYAVQDNEEIITMDWASMGCALFTRNALKKLNYPYQAQPVIATNYGIGSDTMLEDVYLCNNIRKNGLDVNVLVGTSIEHIKRDIDKHLIAKKNNNVLIDLPADNIKHIIAGLQELPYKIADPIVRNLRIKLNNFVNDIANPLV